MRWFGRLFVICVLGAFLLGVAAYFYYKGMEPPSDALYGVQVYYQDKKTGQKIPTRIYYAESIELKDGAAILTDYWSFDGKRYNKHGGEKTILPPYEIVRRLGE